MSEMDELRLMIKRTEAAVRRGLKLTRPQSQALRTGKNLLLEHDYGEGAVEARTCQASGAHRVLYKPGTQADTNAEERWLVVCDDHGTCLGNATRRLGSLAMADPDWCDECQQAAKGRRR